MNINRESQKSEVIKSERAADAERRDPASGVKYRKDKSSVPLLTYDNAALVAFFRRKGGPDNVRLLIVGDMTVPGADAIT